MILDCCSGCRDLTCAARWTAGEEPTMRLPPRVIGLHDSRVAHFVAHRAPYLRRGRRERVSVQVSCVRSSGEGPASARRTCVSERAEAEAILDGDRETAIVLLMRVGELIEANRRLEARVSELEQRLNRSSRNSSLPPSEDPPSAQPRPRRPGSGRPRGGQAGHEGRNRPLLPLERVDELIEYWPERCRACARDFREEERVDAAAPQRHQVCELPPIAVTVSEHRLHRLRCPRCAAETRAELPAAVPRAAFGPRLQAAVATLAVRNRVSRRDSSELVRDLFGAELSTGSVDAIVSRAGGALAVPYARLLRHVRGAPAVNIDETGWRLRGKQRTLWGLLSARAAVFRIAPDRHEREAKALLGEDFAGIAGPRASPATEWSATRTTSSCWYEAARPTRRRSRSRRPSSCASSCA